MVMHNSTKGKSRGFSITETVMVVATITVMTAMAAPSFLRATREQKLNSAAQQITQSFERARYEAVQKNKSRRVFINTQGNSIAVGETAATATYIPLPDGVRFATQADIANSGITSSVPMITEAAAKASSINGTTNSNSGCSNSGTGNCDDDNALSGSDKMLRQCNQAHEPVAFTSLNGMNGYYKAAFNSRGLPSALPGSVNWLYLKGADNDFIAITTTSAGSVRIWKWDRKESVWK
jgi:Tfp pilus assembly protein FimT